VIKNEEDKKAKVAYKLKCMIIKRLELEDIKPEEVADDSPIFGEGLGLDSLAALDLVILLEKEFNVKISDPGQAKEILSTINTLAEYILVHGSVKIDDSKDIN